MRRTTLLAALFAAIPLLNCGIAGAAATDERERAFAIEREFQRMSRTVVLWPGYDPLEIPLAIFTGEQTFLFRHPKTPEGFARTNEALVMEGRHPAATSNSSAEIGSVATATLLADGPRAGRSANDQAAVALHEAFHVYQREHHPSWSGNEGVLFLYPVEDVHLLQLRSAETEALRRALMNRGQDAACWARAALAFREARFAAMDTSFVTYERRSELNEGLATYVQLKAVGASRVEIPMGGFPAAAIRDRLYAVGPAWAFLLDRVQPNWQRTLEANDTLSLDRMLAQSLGSARPSSCTFTPAETMRMEEEARGRVAELRHTRAAHQRDFEERPGWRVTVRSPASQPLWPQGFDPLNVERIEAGILHSRFLKLGNDSGEMQAIDEGNTDMQALTEAAGAHPLFNGIKRVTVAGLSQPEVTTQGQDVIVGAPGFTARFRNAAVETKGTEVTVTLGSK
jgi:hypothetical protein